MRRLLRTLPGDFVLTVVDVGAAGGLNPRWRQLAPVVSAILFDPRESAATGGLGRGQYRVYPIALGEQRGTATLHVTALANMSSFLRPDPAVFSRYRRKGRDAAVVRTEEVAVARLDDLAKADGFRPHVLKIDTQGSELMVLKGAERSLETVVVAEIEVSFFRRYVGQPIFPEIAAWMEARGFELIELHRLKRYRAANRLGLRHPLSGGGQHSGRLAYADAIFLRSPAALLSGDGEAGPRLLQAAVALLAYGKTDHAAALLEDGADRLPPGQAAALGAALSALERKRLIPGLLDRVVRRR